MSTAHQPRDDRAIAHARVEEPHGGRRRLQQGQLIGGAPRNRRLLVAGGHEGQGLLAGVVKTERGRGPARGPARTSSPGPWASGSTPQPPRGGPRAPPP